MFLKLPNALTGAAEDVLPFFLKASTDWQKQCTVVPGGLIFGYKSVTMSYFNDFISPKPTLVSSPDHSIQNIEATILKVFKSGVLTQVLQEIVPSAPVSTPISSEEIKSALKDILQDMLKPTLTQVLQETFKSTQVDIDQTQQMTSNSSSMLIIKFLLFKTNYLYSCTL